MMERVRVVQPALAIVSEEDGVRSSIHLHTEFLVQG